VRLASVPPGTWEVIVAASGWATSSVTVTAPGGPVAVTLSRPCTLAVEVPALAEDPTVATMQIVDASGRVHRTARWFGGVEDRFALVRGRSSVETLAPGRYTVIVSAADGRVWRETVSVAPGAPTAVSLE
jgi:hypothetical protein